MPPPHWHVQNTPRELVRIPPLHLHLIEHPRIRTPPVPQVLHDGRCYRLVHDVFGYAHAGDNHVYAVPRQLAFPCMHDFAEDGMVVVSKVESVHVCCSTCRVVRIEGRGT